MPGIEPSLTVGSAGGLPLDNQAKQSQVWRPFRWLGNKCKNDE